MTINLEPDDLLVSHEIIPNLFVGGVDDIERFKSDTLFEIVDVRSIRWEENRLEYIEGYVLDAFAGYIDIYLKSGKKVFVHCQAGMERSPLVIAWYLVTYHRNRFPDLECAYRHIIEKHPITRRRGQWVDWEERDKRGMFGKKKSL